MKNTAFCSEKYLKAVNARGGSRSFFRRGCTRLLLHLNNIIPHSFWFFCGIPVVLENRRSSRGGGGGAHPLHPSPSSAPECRGKQAAFFFLQISLISLPFPFFYFLFFYFSILFFVLLCCCCFFNFLHLSGVVLRVTNLYTPIT